MKRLFIAGGRVICPKNGLQTEMDLILSNGRIEEVKPPGQRVPDPSDEVIDAHGCLVFPGGLDLETYLRDPGREAEETLQCTLQTAARGGFTSILALPGTTLPVDGGDKVEHRLRMAQHVTGAELLIAGSLTQGLAGKDLAEIGEMSAAGALAFTDGLKGAANLKVLRHALEYTNGFNKPVILPGTLPALDGTGVIHEGPTSTLLGLPGIPDSGEVIATQHHIELARLTGARVHLGALSLARTVRLVKQAQADGVPVTAAVQPWHLLYDESIHQERRYDTLLHLCPPLRTSEDQNALREGVADGTLFLSSGHTPLSPIHKEVEFSDAKAGAISLPTVFAALHSAALQIDISAIVKAFSLGPAQFLGFQDRGHFTAGARGDVCIFDPELEWTVSPSTLGTHVFNTPLLNQSLRGSVRHTIREGQLIYTYSS